MLTHVPCHLQVNVCSLRSERAISSAFAILITVCARCAGRRRFDLPPCRPAPSGRSNKAQPHISYMQRFACGRTEARHQVRGNTFALPLATTIEPSKPNGRTCRAPNRAHMTMNEVCQAARRAHRAAAQKGFCRSGQTSIQHACGPAMRSLYHLRSCAARSCELRSL